MNALIRSGAFRAFVAIFLRVLKSLSGQNRKAINEKSQRP